METPGAYRRPRILGVVVALPAAPRAAAAQQHSAAPFQSLGQSRRDKRESQSRMNYLLRDIIKQTGSQKRKEISVSSGISVWILM